MKDPTVSIIVSTYNRKELLIRCLDSIKEQSYTDFECIVADDGSNYDIDEVVKNYDERFISLKLKHFGNHSHPKNEGTKIAKGEFIHYLDDDNVLRVDHLAVLLKHIDGFDLVYGDRWIINDTDENIQNRLGFTLDFQSGMLMQRNFIDTSDVLMRREVPFTLGGWDERYKKFLDWNFWCRADKYGFKFQHVPIVITDYHLTKGSMSFQKLDSKDVATPGWDPIECEIQLPYLKEITEPRVAIYTLTYNRLSETTVSFGTLHDTANYPFTHIVVDNGSSDGTVDYLKEYAKDNDVQLIINSDNKGISIASNQAVKYALDNKYDIIVKVDNDAIFKTKKWLSKMVDIWKSNRRLALSCYISGLKDNPGGAVRIVYGQIGGELIGMTKHLGGIVHFVDAGAYKTFKWDENDTLHGNQDLAFSMYLNAHGYQMGYLENYFVNHGLDGTVGQYERYKDYFEKRKWEKCHTYGDKYEK